MLLKTKMQMKMHDVAGPLPPSSFIDDHSDFQCTSAGCLR